MSYASTKNIWKCAIQKVTLCFLMVLMKVRWGYPKEVWSKCFTNGCDGGIALIWFKDHFLRCNDRAALVKTWLPAQYTGPSTWVDELVYNRALTLVRIPSLPSPSTSSADFSFLSTSRPMNASAYTKSRCGVYMRCRMTYYRRAIRSWRRTVIRLPLVRTFF